MNLAQWKTLVEPTWHFYSSRSLNCIYCTTNSVNSKVIRQNWWSKCQEKSFHLLWKRWLSVQFNSVVQSCPTLCDPMNRSTPGLPLHYQLPEFTQTHVHQVSDAIQPSHPLLLLLLSPIPPNIRVFSNESTLRMQWPKYRSISPINEHPGLISFRMEWLDLLAVQGTLKSLLKHHNSKASNFQCSAFFTVQLSQPYKTTGKTTALTLIATKRHDELWWRWKWKWLGCVRLFAASWIVTSQAPLSMGFSRLEYWSGLPCLSPGDLTNPVIEPGSPTL